MFRRNNVYSVKISEGKLIRVMKHCIDIHLTDDIQHFQSNPYSSTIMQRMLDLNYGKTSKSRNDTELKFSEA